MTRKSELKLSRDGAGDAWLEIINEKFCGSIRLNSRLDLVQRAIDEYISVVNVELVNSVGSEKETDVH